MKQRDTRQKHVVTDSWKHGRTEGHIYIRNRTIRSRHFSVIQLVLPAMAFYICSCMLGLGHAPSIYVAYLEQMRLLFSEMAVGKTDGHPCSCCVRSWHLVTETHYLLQEFRVGRYSQLSSLKAIEKSREVTGPHASGLVASFWWFLCADHTNGKEQLKQLCLLLLPRPLIPLCTSVNSVSCDTSFVVQISVFFNPQLAHKFGFQP